MSSAVLVDRGPAVFIVTLVVLLVATAFVVLRLISRWGIMRKQSGDDWLVVVSWIFAVGQCVSIMMTTRYGLGKPDANIPPEHSDELAASIYAFTIFYHPALMATKSAILVLYLRMSTGYPFLRIASYVTMAIVNVSGLVLTLLSVFRCRPISAAFSTTEGKCIQLIDLYLSTAPITILTDVAILVLPLPILTALRMESRQKIVLVATFFVGGFVTVVDVVRIVYLQRALEEERGVTINQDGTQANVTYHASFSLMWSAVEVCVGLVCACALVLRPLVMRVVPSMLTGKRRASQQNQRSDNSKEKSPKQPSGVNRKAPVSPMSQKVSVLPGPLPIPGQEQDEYSAAGDRPTGEEDGRDDGAMGFLEMLSGDAETSAPHVQPVLAPQSTLNASEKVTRASGGFSLRPFPTIHRPSAPSIDALQHPTGNFFDFVNMGSRKSLTKLTSREAWWPVISVSVLFFIWGFAYGLLGTLNGEIQALLRYGPDRTIALHSSYWIAYAVSPPLIGYWTLTRTSFKFTFITGLCLYSVGAMSFWPSAVLLSYGGFFVSNFIIAAGLACLEVAANPFIALAGPEHLSEARLNFAQGIQAVGSIFSPMLAKKVMFRRVNAVSLFNVQWWYLAVALFVIALAVVFYYVPLADATDDDLEDAANETLAWANLDRSARLPMPFGKRAPPGYILLLLGAIIMFFYVGAQETISYFWGPIFYAIHQDTDEDPFWNQAIAHAVFAVGRFLASFACYIGVPPRLVLLFCIFGAFLTSLLTLVLPVPSEGAHGTLILISFFESAIFPTLFALVIRNQGKDLKLVSTIMIGAVSGGAVMPAIGHGVALHNDNLAEGRRPLIIVVVLYGLSLLFPIWLCGGMRKWVDPIRPSRRGSGDAVELQMAPSARSDATSIAKIIEPLDQK